MNEAWGRDAGARPRLRGVRREGRWQWWGAQGWEVEGARGRGAIGPKRGRSGGRLPKRPLGQNQMALRPPPPQIEDGWWLGKKNGQLGAFPSNFVELLDSGPPSETCTL